MSSTLRLANTRPCWNVRAIPRRGDRLRPQALNRLALEENFALVRPVEAAHHVEGRRLAGAVRADEADKLALVDRKIERPDRRDAAKAARQSPYLQPARHV